MKRLVKYVLAILLLAGAGCGHVENLEKDNYVPPSVKFQPSIYYPPLAQEKYYTGSTKVILFVTKEGDVKDVDVVKSSGYDVLDKFVINYCREIIFNPALGYGRPINSRVAWEVKFNLSDQDLYAKDFVAEIQKLFEKELTVLPSERNKIRKTILEKDSEFVLYMKDGLNFNNVIEKIILPDISLQWKNEWDSFPLTFLLYYDFIKRYPDYNDMQNVRKKLYKAVTMDLHYIKNTSAINDENKKVKDYLLIKINKFIHDNLPDMKPGLINSDEGINS